MFEVTASTGDEKRALAKYLKHHDPEVLAFLKQAAEIFGPSERVTYTSKREQDTWHNED